MPDYIRRVAHYHPTTLVRCDGDPFVYANLVYLSGPAIPPQATLDAYDEPPVSQSLTVCKCTPVDGQIVVYRDAVESAQYEAWPTTGVGSGDVTAAANLDDNSIIRGDGGGKGVQKSWNGTYGWKIEDDGRLHGYVDQMPDEFCMTLRNNIASGEFIQTLNFNGNPAHEIRQNLSGDGLLRIYMNGGNQYFKADSGVVKIGDTSDDVDYSFPLWVVRDDAGWVAKFQNKLGTGGGHGFCIMAGEVLGDISFHIADEDDSFQIMEMEADQGFITMGKTYAQTLTDNGIVYGVDLQHPGTEGDNAISFNTQHGTYRVAGVEAIPPKGGTTSQVLAKASNSDYDMEWVSGGGAETDPVFSASPAAGILAGDISEWDAAYGWGDHALAGYLTSYTETDPVFGASPAAGIATLDITNWNTAYGWGNHASAGYLTAEVNDLSAAVTWVTVPNAYISQGSVTQHEGAINHDALLNFVQNEHATPKNSIEIDVGQLQLVSDAASPGNDKLYGTNGSGVKGWYDQPSGGGGVFGSEYQKNSSTGLSTTTSTTYQTKLTLTATGLTPGYTYCIAYNSMVGSYEDDKHMDARLTVGGTTHVEGEDSGKTASASYWSFSGVIYLTGLSGSVDIDLDFRDGGDGGTVLMRQAYLQIWRAE